MQPLEPPLVALALSPRHLGHELSDLGRKRGVGKVLEQPGARAQRAGADGRQHGRLRIFVFKVLDDDRGVVNGGVLVDQHRNPRKRVQAQELGAPLVVLGKIDLDELVGKALLRQNNPHFLTEWAGQEIVEFHHTRMAL